ncbi:energy-coupling factor ABC transporter ATP-binding protein [Rhabdochromatium marinum]|uniref:energy-coupling factor ABC transporter ATP-binding protein n=1 Tax=Rhabdochromatium marinum TaxID=48729 RepID=UPI001F5BD527|nr:ABC transporter ATP-binding protein [Rhabdochromatium marinum]
MAELFRVRDLWFAYPGRAPVLRGVDLDLAPGQRLAVTGANGAGKSTLLWLLLGLLRPNAGQIEAFGAPRRVEAEFIEVRHRAGLVFQDPDNQLFCPTVLEDCAFGPLCLGRSRAQALAVVDRTLEQLGLLHLRERITYQLSGGEKRLVSLAAVLCMEPEVLLLDEPSNGLDETTGERLLCLLKALPQAMLLVSHDRAFREHLATTGCHLHDGRLIAPPPQETQHP